MVKPYPPLRFISNERLRQFWGAAADKPGTPAPKIHSGYTLQDLFADQNFKPLQSGTSQVGPAFLNCSLMEETTAIRNIAEQLGLPATLATTENGIDKNELTLSNTLYTLGTDYAREYVVKGEIKPGFQTQADYVLHLYNHPDNPVMFQTNEADCQVSIQYQGYYYDYDIETKQVKFSEKND